jgi:hypothetical protein
MTTTVRLTRPLLASRERSESGLDATGLPAQQPRLACTGRFATVTHHVRSVVVPQFIHVGGLSVLNGVTMTNSALVDAWNSSAGP